MNLQYFQAKRPSNSYTPQADADDDDDMGDDDGDGSGFNVAEMKLKAAKLAADINDAEDRDTEEVRINGNFC